MRKITKWKERERVYQIKKERKKKKKEITQRNKGNAGIRKK